MEQEIALHIIGYAWTAGIAVLSIAVYYFCIKHDIKRKLSVNIFLYLT